MDVVVLLFTQSDAFETCFGVCSKKIETIKTFPVWNKKNQSFL